MQRALLALWPVLLGGCMSGRTALSAVVVAATVVVVGRWAARRRSRSSLSGATSIVGPVAGVSHGDLSSSGMVPTLRLPPPTEKLPQLLLALEDARSRHDISEECDLLLDLARSYSDAADYPCAVDNLNGCLMQSSKHADETFAGQALLEAAYVHLRAKQVDRAVQSCDAALALAEKLPNRPLTLMALDRLSDVWALSGHLPEAIASADKRLRLTEPSDEMQVPALLRLAELHLVARKYAESQRLFERALEAANRTAQERDESWVLARMARAALLMGQPQRAVALLSPRLEQVLSWSEMFDSARVLSVLGESYLELELYDKAIEAFARHRCLLRHQNDDRVRLLAQLTLAYRRLGRSADATNCFRECDSLSSKLGPASLPTLVVLSEAYLSNGEAQAAMFTAQLALDLAKTAPRSDGESWGLLALGRAQLELGQLERAAAGLQKALELLDTPTDRRLESLIHAVLADVLGKLGQPQAAQASRQIRQDYLREIRQGCTASSPPV
ncbi:MAG: hypothetical protein JNM83_23745 [Myxococcales bacterium]|nr:hypothetical protein [Myxococcales bacterium]